MDKKRFGEQVETKMKISRYLFYGITFILLVLAACGGNQDDLFEEEHLIFTQEHGKLAINLLENFVSSWKDVEVDVLGVRVIDYVENEKIKIIGCTQERFDLHYPNKSKVLVDDYDVRRIYIFQFNDGKWKFIESFTINYENIDQTYNDWWYFPEDKKELIGELPKFNYWNCLLFVENLND